MKKYFAILASTIILLFTGTLNASANYFENNSVSAATNTQNASFSIDDLAKAYGKNGLNYISMIEYSTDGNGFKQLSLTTNFDFLNTENNKKYNLILAASFNMNIKFNQLRLFSLKSKNIAFIKTDNYIKFSNGKLSNSDFIKTIELVPNSNFIAPTNNNTAINNTSPSLYSNDMKVYLGKLTTNTFDKDSIYNEFGTYGNKFNDKSIWNEFGTYGSKFSAESAFNDLASKPPVIVYNGKVIGHLTSNITISDGVSIAALSNWLTQNGF